MKSISTILVLILTTAGVVAQHLDEGGGGIPTAYQGSTKLRATVSSERRWDPPGVDQRDLGAAASSTQTTDPAQVSSFPFQESYSTFRSYYESCPITLGSGDLLVLFASPGFDTLYSVKSTDGGSTWSAPTFVISSKYFHVLTGIRTASGRIVVVWSASNVIGTTGYGLSMGYSDNDGATWSAAQTISSITTDNYTSLTQTLNGKLWLCYSRYNPGTYYDAYYRTSTDNGITWSAEQTFAATSSYDYYTTIVSKDSSTTIAFLANNSSGNYDIYLKTSTDGGTTWSSASAVANTTTTETRPRVLRQSDGTLWLVYQHYKTSTGGYTQSEIAYKKSTDGGATWSSVSYLTNYAGYDGWFNACLKNNQPFVTFASWRWCELFYQTHLWFGLIGTSTDNNTPPTLTTSSNSSLVGGSSISVLAYVDDEAGISSVQLYDHVNGTLHGPVQMYDDGVHGDNSAGDKIYGGTVGPFQIGDVFDISIKITDVNSNTVSVYVNSFTIPAVHNAGNVILKFFSTSQLGDLGASPGSCAYWPKTNGNDYLYDGGLWIGCNVGGQNVVMKHFYGISDDWHRTNASACTLLPGVSDQDGDMTYDDVLAPSSLGLTVHQQSYQWSQSTRDDFIIFKYTFTNRGIHGTLNNIYAGLWTDPDVAFQTNPLSNAVGYDAQRHLIYAYHPQGTPAGYFGMKLLGSGTVPATVYGWRAGQLSENVNMPYYQCLTKGSTTLPDTAGDVRMLLSASPFSLTTNATKMVAFGIVLGNGLSELQTNADTMEAIFNVKLATSVDAPSTRNKIPKEFGLGQNYPNPFNPTTNFQFSIPARPAGGSNLQFVKLSVFDLLGREVAQLVNGEMPAGTYTATWDASHVPSGMYLYRLTAGSFHQTKKMLVAK